MTDLLESPDEDAYGHGYGPDGRWVPVDVRGAAHTNSIESVWAVLKRGIMGVYHSTSAKHLPRYVDEFTFRLNEGNVKVHTLDRLDSFVDGTADKRLTYKRLIACQN